MRQETKARRVVLLISAEILLDTDTDMRRVNCRDERRRGTTDVGTCVPFTNGEGRGF
jgi:hypothetical protein